MRIIYIFLCCFFVLTMAGCKRPARTTNKTAHSEESRKLPAPPPKIVACDLATKDEVGAIQGAQLTEPVGNEGAQGEFYMSECYYGSNEPNRSVSIAVIQRTAQYPGKRMVSDFWRETFEKAIKEDERGTEEEKEKQHGQREAAEKSRNERKEHEGPLPVKVDDLGQEAYWIGNSMGGILYVLQDDRMLRISFGGPDPAQKKLEKSRELAEKALKRL